MSEDDTLTHQVDEWLQPVPEAESAGGRPVSDDALREFKVALAGKPDTQFSEAVPPDFRKVLSLAGEIFGRTRDLRIAVGWCRASLRTKGIAALPQGLRLLQGLLETFGEELHPMADPEDGSHFARANALSVLSESTGLLGDLRQTVLLSDRMHGEVRFRTIEIALGKLSPREDEAVLTPDQLQKFFATAAAAPALRTLLTDARSRTKSLTALLGEQLDALDAPDLAPLVAMIDIALSMIPAQQAAAAEMPASEAASAAGAAVASGPAMASAQEQAMAGKVQSRADVVRAIDMACEYLERAEPSNPAQLLLRRAKQLLDHNFLQLIHVLAPNSLDEVAKLMGVDPVSLTSPADSA